MGGHLAHLLHGIPHVITAHSLEPRRPWKAEQLGGGYRVSSWVERTAYEHADAIIAVSDGMRADVLDCYPTVHPERVHVVRNGIDADIYRPVPDTDALRRFQIGASIGTQSMTTPTTAKGAQLDTAPPNRRPSTICWIKSVSRGAPTRTTTMDADIALLRPGSPVEQNSP